MNRVRWNSALLVCVCLVAATTSRAGDLDVDDITGTGTISAVDWQPIITEFFAADNSGQSIVRPIAANEREGQTGYKPLQSIYGEASQWMALKPQIAWRGDDEKGIPAYGEKEPVITGWQRFVNEKKQVVYLVYNSNGATAENKGQPMILCVHSAEHIMRVGYGLDVLMNKDDKFKEDMLRQYFKIGAVQITARKIADKREDFRAALPAGNTTIYKVFSIGSENDTTGGADFSDAIMRGHSSISGSLVDWKFGPLGVAPGVYELRIMVRVNGRFNTSSEFVSKTVTGAIRVAIVEDQIYEIRKLSFESARRPGQKDIWTLVGGGLGTTQESPVPKSR